jgi:phosphohistidine phosphatase SixA
MIVGHLPILQKLASLALVATDSSQLIGFQQGGVVCLRQDEDGHWQIRFVVTPELFK